MAIRPRVAAAIAGGAALVAISTTAASAQGLVTDVGGARITIDGSKPLWAAAATKLGPAGDTDVRHVQIGLALRDLAEPRNSPPR